MNATALIIDDDPRIRKLIEHGLRRHGLTVFTAENGRQGLRLFDELHPDLVITDILMPDVEGIETIMTLKGAASPPKVIAISGGGRLAGREFLKWAKHLGADEVLPKPFRLSDLVATAKALLDEQESSEPPAQPRGQASTPDVLPRTINPRASLTSRRDMAFISISAAA